MKREAIIANQQGQTAEDTIRAAAARWPSTFIARSKVPEFSGGSVAVGTMANADSAGKGVRGAFRIGRKVCYPVQALCDWLVARMEG